MEHGLDSEAQAKGGNCAEQSLGNFRRGKGGKTYILRGSESSALVWQSFLGLALHCFAFIRARPLHREFSTTILRAGLESLDQG
jgi:hypothetical protein